MTESREFYGATVQEALDRAASALSAAPQDLDYKVVDEGSSGFLGIGARDARIEVLAPQAPAVEEIQAQPPTSAESSETDGASLEPMDTDQEMEDQRAGESGVVTPAVSQTETSEQPPEVVEAQEVPEELLLAVDGTMTRLLDLLGFDGTVDARDAGQDIVVDVSTPQTGLFIGQKGETIDAVQYLLNLIVYKNRPFVKRVFVDSEGYRQRRVEAIQGMANRMARRARREGRPVRLPPMSAAERRVVHVFLKENPGVSTTSEGEDENRQVIIAPS